MSLGRDSKDEQAIVESLVRKFEVAEHLRVSCSVTGVCQIVPMRALIATEFSYGRSPQADTCKHRKAVQSARLTQRLPIRASESCDMHDNQVVGEWKGFMARVSSIVVCPAAIY